MDLAKAKSLLNSCIREEMRDHAFGDVEIIWAKNDIPVAYGYFGRSTANVSFSSKDGVTIASFKGENARQLRKFGTQGRISRNDEVGPEEYIEGKIMPGLTTEAIFEELTNQ